MMKLFNSIQMITGIERFLKHCIIIMICLAFSYENTLKVLKTSVNKKKKRVNEKRRSLIIEPNIT